MIKSIPRQYKNDQCKTCGKEFAWPERLNEHLDLKEFGRMAVVRLCQNWAKIYVKTIVQSTSWNSSILIQMQLLWKNNLEDHIPGRFMNMYLKKKRLSFAPGRFRFLGDKLGLNRDKFHQAFDRFCMQNTESTVLWQ